MLTEFTCKVCESHTWRQDASKRGLFGDRTCPVCLTQYRINRDNVRTLARSPITIRHGRVTTSERLHSVVGQDGRILCAKCHAETDLTSGQDGRLGSVSGVFCALCLATFPVKTVNAETVKKHYIRVMPVSWNTPEQAREAELGILAIARHLARTPDRDLDYGILLSGANWAGIKVRSMPDRYRQDGQTSAEYVNAQRTAGRVDVAGSSYFISADSAWILGSGQSHPKRCECRACNVRHSAGIKRVIIRTPRPAVQWSHNGQTLARCVSRPAGIGQVSTALVSGILERPERPTITATRCDTWRDTYPRATPPRPDPAMPWPSDNAVSRAFRRTLQRACANTL